MSRQELLYEMYTDEGMTSCKDLLGCLLCYYEKESSAKEQISLSSLLLVSGKKPITPKIEPIPTGDYRLKRMTITNFRKFPKADGELAYGIDFTKDNQPLSTYIVGANGTGKSSIYAALERYYTGCVSSREDRKLESNEPYELYGYGRIESVSEKDMEVKCVVNKKDTSAKDVTIPVFPRALFCSETDVRKLQEAPDLSAYILDQMGYGAIKQLETALDILEIDCQNMKTHASLMTEEGDSEAKIDAIMLLSHICGNNSVYDACTATSHICEGLLESLEVAMTSTGALLIEAIEEARKCVTKLREKSDKSKMSHILRYQIDKILVHETELMVDMDMLLSGKAKLSGIKGAVTHFIRTMQEVTKVVSTCKTDGDKMMKVAEYIESVKINDYKKRSSAYPDERILIQLDNQIKELKKSVTLRKKAALKELMTILPECEKVLNAFSEGREEISFIETDGRLKAVIKVMDKDKMVLYETNPREHYNSFRFRLYVVMLKLSIAFALMQRGKYLAPFVMDDMLNASDVDNSHRLESFVQNLYRVAYLTLDGHWLQLILLTHDGVIQQAFQKGSSFISMPDHTIKNVPHQQKRLFDYRGSGTLQEEYYKGKKLEYKPIVI